MPSSKVQTLRRGRYPGLRLKRGKAQITERTYGEKNSVEIVLAFWRDEQAGCRARLLTTSGLCGCSLSGCLLLGIRRLCCGRF